MAERILVSTEDMVSTVQAYNSAKTKQENAYLQISNAVRVLDGSWDGEASEAFKTAFNGLYNNIQQSAERMQDAANELTTSADIFSQAEMDAMKAVSSLEQGKAFPV